MSDVPNALMYVINIMTRDAWSTLHSIYAVHSVIKLQT